MKTVAETIGVARSQLHDRVHLTPKPRGPYRKPEDDTLVQLVRRLVDERPTYGYRRITAMANRERDKAGEPPVNHKRVFRIMRRNSMLLARHTGSRNGRVHDGKVIVMRSNLRWCSDGFEISCWNGDLIRIAFIIDAHDREIIAWHAVVGSGISGSMVRDMMLEAVESRFGALQAPAPIEWLTDNGSAYTARQTRERVERNLVMKRFVSIATSAAIVSLAGQAMAAEVDMSRLTCKEVGAMAAAQAVAVAMWMIGYVHGKAAIPRWTVTRPRPARPRSLAFARRTLTPRWR